ncbi:hypothetical protein [Pseudaquabacterium rugosum]|uniref:Uncharacterized protein n=1 Tax=Pseudaquabacterium rugosum TaxID=2984194 RepID=A0ABU9BE38_9BURK
MPTFSALQGTAQESGTGLWRVTVRVQRLAIVHEWTGFASSADQAKGRGMTAARAAWPGFSFVLSSAERVA